MWQITFYLIWHRPTVQQNPYLQDPSWQCKHISTRHTPDSQLHCLYQTATRGCVALPQPEGRRAERQFIVYRAEWLEGLKGRVLRCHYGRERERARERERERGGGERVHLPLWPLGRHSEEICQERYAQQLYTRQCTHTVFYIHKHTSNKTQLPEHVHTHCMKSQTHTHTHTVLNVRRVSLRTAWLLQMSQIGGRNTFRLESLKLVFQPLHKFLVNKLWLWKVS